MTSTLSKPDSGFVASTSSATFKNVRGGASAEEGTAADADAPAKGPAATATVAYMVRAVTPGAFVHPAATVEDMYHPQRYARSAAGKLTVTASE